MKPQRRTEERRRETRLLCADLVTVYWLDGLGNRQKAVANLEDVSHCGACLMMDTAVAPETEVRIDTGRGHYLGDVRYASRFDSSYLIGIQFQPGCEWEPSKFEPAHLFDPRTLIAPEGARLQEPAQSAPDSQPAGITVSDLHRLLKSLSSDLD